MRDWQRQRLLDDNADAAGGPALTMVLAVLPPSDRRVASLWCSG
jgi:hypothetical protein